MYKTIIICMMLCSYAKSFSQIGINTTAPTATLDVNGDLRIRQIDEETNIEIAADSVLIVGRDGVVKRISSQLIINSVFKSAVKGGFSGTGGRSLSLTGTTVRIPYDFEDFDLNDEFDVTTNIFTSKQPGIFEIKAQVNSNNSLQTSLNHGICILKNGVVIAMENYSNKSISSLLSSLNITPPVRSVTTLVQLDAGDTISFRLFTDLSLVVLSENTVDSFFSIVQLR